ncbi:MAG: hypothetical protein LRZ88_07735 [Candidatus Cloacimonetes bacterium]|nr:hypothetical protein [Candidatus Cloacimonadota bacterium]
MLDLKIGDYNWDMSFEDVNCDAAEVLTGTALREILEEFMPSPAWRLPSSILRAKF